MHTGKHTHVHMYTHRKMKNARAKEVRVSLSEWNCTHAREAFRKNKKHNDGNGVCGGTQKVQ